MRPISSSLMNKSYLTQTPATGSPLYYSWNGVDASGNALVDLYPKPTMCTLRFNIVDRADPFTLDSDKLYVPSQPVINYAIALASRDVEKQRYFCTRTILFSRYHVSGRVAFDAARFPLKLFGHIEYGTTTTEHYSTSPSLRGLTVRIHLYPLTSLLRLPLVTALLTNMGVQAHVKVIRKYLLILAQLHS